MELNRTHTRCDVTPEPFEKVFGSFDGICSGCETFARLNDLSLCNDYAAKLDRDLIRQRDWDYAILTFGVPVDQREALRRELINTYGGKLELIMPRPAKRTTRKRKRRRFARNDRLKDD